MTEEQRIAFERELKKMRQTIKDIMDLASRLDSAAEVAMRVLKENHE